MDGPKRQSLPPEPVSQVPSRYRVGLPVGMHAHAPKLPVPIAVVNRFVGRARIHIEKRGILDGNEQVAFNSMGGVGLDANDPDNPLGKQGTR